MKSDKLFVKPFKESVYNKRNDAMIIINNMPIAKTQSVHLINLATNKNDYQNSTNKSCKYSLVTHSIKNFSKRISQSQLKLYEEIFLLNDIIGGPDLFIIDNKNFNVPRDRMKYETPQKGLNQ